MTDRPDPDRGDAHLHELFAGLRSQVAEVVHDFSERVMSRVESEDQEPRPSLGGLVVQILVEMSNLFSREVLSPEDMGDDGVGVVDDDLDLGEDDHEH